MAFTAFANASKVCVEFSWNGAAVTVCLHFRKTAPSAADYQALADEVDTQWIGQLIQRQASDLVMGDVIAQDLSSEGAPQFTSSTGSGTPGSQAIDGVPNNTAAVISHRTNDTGRSSRGRTYFPGISENQVVDGLYTAASRDALLINWGQFTANILANVGWTFVVAQRFSGGVQLTTGVTRDVTAEILPLQLGSQRRRQVQSAS